MTLHVSSYTSTERGITMLFEEAVEQATPFYPVLCTIRPSGGRDEAYAMLGSIPTMRKWLGERQFKQIAAAKFTLENILWEDSLRFEKTDLEDDRLGMHTDVIGMLGDEAAYHPDKLVIETMTLGETSQCWDGQFFYDTDHLWRDSGAQSNLLTITGHAAPTNPTVTEARTAAETAIKQLLGFKKDNGEPWIRPRIGRLDDLLITCPLSMRKAMHEAFEATFKVDAGGNAGVTNVLIENPQIATIAHLGSGFLGNDAHFYVHWLGGRLKPFVFQDRRPLATSMYGWEDNRLKEVFFMADARYNVGYLAWFYSVKVKLTA